MARLGIFHQPAFQRIRRMVQNHAVGRIVSRLFDQHICQHGDDGPLAVGHYIYHIILRYIFTSDLNNQIRQPLGGKKLINTVRIGKNRVRIVTTVQIECAKPRGGNSRPPRPRPQHIGDVGGGISKGSTTFGIIHIQRIVPVVVLKLQLILAIITNGLHFLFIILLISIIGNMGFVPQFLDIHFFPVILLVRNPVVIRHRLVAPVKRNNRRTTRRGDFFLCLFVVHHHEILPFMRVEVSTVKALTQTRNNAIFLVLIRFTHIIHTMHQYDDTGHGAGNRHIAGLGRFPKIFMHRHIVSGSYARSIRTVFFIRHEHNSSVQISRSVASSRGEHPSLSVSPSMMSPAALLTRNFCLVRICSGSSEA